MSEPITLLGIAGSLRRGSFNAALLREAVAVAPEGVTLEIASIREVPLYDGDVEAEQGIPAAVSALKDRVAAAHGLLIVTPEYNNSVPGVLKNAIDWMSRPSSDIRRVFGGLPLGMIGASAGPGGTGLAQVAWLPVWRTLGAQPWFGGRLQVGPGGKIFDGEGRITDPAVRTKLTEYMAGFADYVRRAKR